MGHPLVSDVGIQMDRRTAVLCTQLRQSIPTACRPKRSCEQASKHQHSGL